MHKIPNISLICLLTCISVTICQAGGSRRIAAKQQTKTQPLSGYAARTKYSNGGMEPTHLQIYSRKTGRVAWSGVLGHIPDAKDFSWSADHMMAAVIEYQTDGTRRLLIWQAGKGMRVISHLPVSARQEQQSHVDDVLTCDSVGVATLSPDKRRVLLLASPGQGNASVGLNQLWCLTLRTCHLQFIYKDSYAWENYQQPRWVNSHRIAYTQRHINEAKGRKWEFVPVTQTL